MQSKSIAMLLSNPFRPDPRVLKEALSLAEQGYTLTILAWDRTGELAPSEQLALGLSVHRIQHVRSGYGIGASQILRLPRFWFACLGELNRLKPDLVHCHDFDTLPAGLVWGRLHRRPVIYDAHEYYAQLVKPRLRGRVGTMIYQAVRLSEQLGARLADAVITVDETLASIYRILNKIVLVVGHYPQRAFAAQPSAAFSGSSLNLIYAGRLSRDRGLLLYAGILRQLLRLGIPARLTLAGVFTPAAEETTFRSHAADLMEHVDIQGWVDFKDMPQALRQADVGLALLLPEPRYVAALPVNLFEYMAAGLPVVASSFPAITQIVEDTQCGIVVDPLSSPTDIARQIAVWWQNPEQARMLGEAGRKAIQERYNFETLAQPMGLLYEQLLRT